MGMINFVSVLLSLLQMAAIAPRVSILWSDTPMNNNRLDDDSVDVEEQRSLVDSDDGLDDERTPVGPL